MDFRVAPQAESDLDEIWHFLATQSSNIDIADRVIDSITARFALLARQPYIGRRRDEDLRPGVRSFVVGDYVIAYRVDGDNVLVLRVLRGSRDIEALFRDELGVGTAITCGVRRRPGHLPATVHPGILTTR